MNNFNPLKIEIVEMTRDNISENLDLLNQVIREGHFLASKKEISKMEANDFFTFWVESKLSIYLIARYMGKLVGHISNRPREEDRLNHIGAIGYLVHHDFRKMGIASMLMEKIIELSKNQGFKILVAEVSHDNIASLALLKKFQFKKFGRLKKALKVKENDYRDIIMLSKTII